MFDRLNLYKPLHLIMLIFTGISIAGLYFIDKSYFYFWSLIWVLIATFVLFKSYCVSRDNQKFFDLLRNAIFGVQEDSLTQFPMATVIARGSGEIVWENPQFVNEIFGGEELFTKNLFELLPSIDFTQHHFEKGYNIVLNEKQYTCYVVRSEQNAQPVFMVYFVDDHKLKVDAQEYLDSKPWVCLMLIDNYTELFTNAKENERSKIMGDIEQIIESFAESYKGLIRKLDKDRYMVVLEDRYMKEILAQKFQILNSIRSVETGERIPATMSIGVGSMLGDLHESEYMSRQALDMALGRGGDQAAVRLETGYEFYGGISKGVEKRNKVRTRIVANAINELVDISDNIFVMGHRFADLDSLGSCIGIHSALKDRGKDIKIVLNTQTCLAQSLYNKIIQSPSYQSVFISPEEAEMSANKKSLIIIVDTHVRTLVECPELCRKSKNIVVIDHHRKMVDHIDDAIVFFHEPFASSAAEMVTELIQYLSKKPAVLVEEAEAVLAGIMLDTKNFTIRTGVRTFEAAAVLRKMGADTIEVRKLFSSSMETYQQKTRLVAGAEAYRGCALAVTEGPLDDIRIVTAQAADELLTISDVDASFVMYESDGVCSISARSMGKINVQLIMESLGGGGHQTMAAVQIPDTNVEAGRQKLLTAIDKYIDDQPA